MPTLYVVATPIGNLEDISLRALRVLKEVDLIACEDTRRTKILLDRYEITTPVVSYHQHSRLTKIDWLVRQLAAGKDIALVSDAGTPGVNDPGGKLIAAAIKWSGFGSSFTSQESRQGETPPRRSRNQSSTEEIPTRITIVPIPGANAGVTLLSVSGWPADQYLFLGYLPKKKGRATLLRRLPTTDYRLPLILYESPYRLVRTLQDFQNIFPDGQVVIGRELTKKFEEIWRGTLAEATHHWSANKPRGEFVLLIG